jgi:hypothetical protein
MLPKVFCFCKIVTVVLVHHIFGRSSLHVKYSHNKVLLYQKKLHVLSKEMVILDFFKNTYANLKSHSIYLYVVPQ